jgi:hypothetical protein
VVEGTGTQDPTTGVWTPVAADQVVYDGPADVQDRGAVLSRDGSGRLVEVWDAEAFLPLLAATVLGRIRPDQPCNIRWADGSLATAEVVRLRRLDHAVELKRLVPV